MHLLNPKHHAENQMRRVCGVKHLELTLRFVVGAWREILKVCSQFVYSLGVSWRSRSVGIVKVEVVVQVS